jgi:hypothetical protein
MTIPILAANPSAVALVIAAVTKEVVPWASAQRLALRRWHFRGCRPAIMVVVVVVIVGDVIAVSPKHCYHAPQAAFDCALVTCRLS